MQPTSRAALKRMFQAAPAFQVFQPVNAFGAPEPPQRPGENWDLFHVDALPHDSVLAEVETMGIELSPMVPQRVDEASPKSFDDLDAAIEALLDDHWLVKLPDSLRGKDAQYYRLYVVNAIKPPNTHRVTIVRW